MNITSSLFTFLASLLISLSVSGNPGYYQNPEQQFYHDTARDLILKSFGVDTNSSIDCAVDIYNEAAKVERGTSGVILTQWYVTHDSRKKPVNISFFYEVGYETPFGKKTTTTGYVTEKMYDYDLTLNDKVVSSLPVKDITSVNVTKSNCYQGD